jgi:sphinganine-1-phosphate aldolase
VTAARSIEQSIRNEIPELYILGKPPASVVAFAASDKSVNVMEIGDAMSRRGWHLNAISNPPAVHIACTVRRVTFADSNFLF